MSPRRSATAALLIAIAGAAACGCGRAAREQARARTASLEQALRPSFFAAAFHKMGGGHFHASTRFVITPTGDAAGTAATTTTTDVWLDRAGNYRLSETNDRDGGREVVLYGRELSTALRYGKMIRRVAEEPEPTQLLEEALGSPWAAWEVVAPMAAIEPGPSQLLAGASAADYRISKGDAISLALPTGEQRALRKWRGTVAVQTLAGDMLVDERSGALVKADLTAAFTLTEEQRPMQGEVEVHAVLSDAAAVPAIERPAAEELALRQRIVPEQKEMLHGLGGRVPPPPPPPPAKKKKKGHQ